MADIVAALDRYFGITEKGSNIRTEVKGGVIIFLAMLYILVSNPAIINSSGTLNTDALFTATALSTVIACIASGLLAKFPVAMAPGMGINAFVSFTIMGAMGFTWAQALMAVLISGILFLIVSLTGLRSKMLDAIPVSFRLAITAGIGLFIATVGLIDAGIINFATGTPAFGPLGDLEIALGIFCIIVTFILYFRKWWGAVIGGILLTAVVGMIIGVIELPKEVLSTPNFEYFAYVFTDFEMFENAMIPSFIIAVFALFMVDMFDSAGTLLSIGERAGMVKDGGFSKEAGKALMVDSGATITGAVLGTSTVTSFIESQTGIEAGGRTGLMPVIVGLLFLLAMFFFPIFEVITFPCIVGALVFVGVCMLASVKDIDWKDPVIATTAFLVIAIMTLSYSISNGIGFGAIAYVIGMLVTGRREQLNKGMICIALIFAVYFVAYYAVIPIL